MRVRQRRRVLAALPVAALVVALVVALPVVAVGAEPGLAAPTAQAASGPPAVGGAELATTGTVANAALGVPALPAEDAAGWLVADLDTGDVLAAHDPHGRYAPASTLKMLTALTVIPQLSPTQQVTATSAEVNVDGTRVGVVPGHTYTVAELLLGMLMVSGNDAARVLTGPLGGPATVEAEMDARAAALNADDTHAATVTGLDAAGQTSSAYDLALIARAALALPSFATAVDTQRAQFAGAGVTSFQIANHNPLLGSVDGVYGVKNGYTVAAQASYVGVARRDGHDVLVALIRTRPDFTAQATALLNWGFAADGRVAPVGVLVGPGPLPSTRSSARPVPALASTASRRAPRSRHTSGVEEALVGLLAGSMLVILLGRRRRRSRRGYGHYRRRGSR